MAQALASEIVDCSGIIRIAFFFGLLVLVILLVSAFWIIRLRKEVRIRQKTQEELIRAKEEAENANQEKSLFLARMAHDIRTPLNAIMGMAFLMKKTNLNTTQEIYMEKLTEVTHNMLGVINDILNFSKVEAGRVEVERIPFNLDKVVQDMVNIISVKVEERGIEFEFHKEPNLPVFFLGDPVRLEEILLNILNNAVKFTEKGTVSLSARVLTRERDIYRIEFTIQDTGIGMDSEQIKGLFTPFRQGDSSINRRYGGAGLGLSIVKNLVDLMGGEIRVDSVPGEGSVFKVVLPLEADPSQEHLYKKALCAHCFSGTRALVLDKNPNDRQQLGDWLSAFGIKGDLVDAEEEAIRRICLMVEEGSPYDLLLIDFLTPEDGGLEFLQKVKKNLFVSEKNRTKAILMVPIAREDLLGEMSKAGYDYGLAKPIIPSTLYHGLIELCKTEHYGTQEKVKEREALRIPRPYHILLVEDNKINQFITQNVLEQVGFTVTVADNGKRGYTYVLEHKDVDLILMDLHMPIMDGYTAVDLIRKNNSDIPIVAMTADPIHEAEEKYKNHGIHCFVSKPFEPNVLVQTVLGVLNLSQACPNEKIEANFEVDPKILDTSLGMKQIGGDRDFYRLVLKSFREENEGISSDLQTRIQQGDYGGARQIVHKIKGSSGSIGAQSLFRASSQLQRALEERDEKRILIEFKHFQQHLHSLLTELKKMN